MVRAVCRGKPGPARIRLTSGVERQAISAFPIAVECRCIRLPIHVVSRIAPITSAFSTWTAYPWSRTAMCPVMPLFWVNSTSSG